MSLTIQTPNTASNGITNMGSRYAMTRQEVDDFITELNTPGFINNVAKLFSTPVENVVSLFCFPFDVKKLLPAWEATNDEHIIVNIITMQDSYGSFLNPLSTPLLDLGSVTINEYFGDFRDYAPYTKLELYLPYIGVETLDNDIVIGNTIKIRYAVDLYTGRCTAFILKGDSPNETLILSRDGNIGMQVQIAGGVGADLTRSMLQVGIAGVTGAVAAGRAITSNAVVRADTDVPGNGAGGIVGTLLGNTAINTVNAMQVHVPKTGSTIPNTSFYAPQNAILISTRTSATRPSGYDALRGRPSGKSKTLSSLSGFTIVDSLHVEGLGTATSDEISEIERLLKSGVIL